MVRALTLTLAFSLLSVAQAQTYFYINEIVVQPQPATTEDDITIDLNGGLASTGAYVSSASASVEGSDVIITISAADPGGLTVIVPHTETIALGQLAAGDYTISFITQGVGDFAPQPEHTFSVAGDACSGLDLISLEWHPFTDTAVVVHVQNNNSTSELFDYPNFILLDNDGDTLAKETVNFFGIGADSWHVLRVQPGADLSTPVNGILELWTGFTTQLACSWSFSDHELCPATECTLLYPVLQNVGGALSIGTFSWVMSDANGIAASGQFELTAESQSDEEVICVPPGNYEFSIAADEPTGGQLNLNIYGDGFLGGPSNSVAGSGQATFFLFSLLEPCIDGTNSIPTTAPKAPTVQSMGDVIRITTSTFPTDPELSLMDAQGRCIARTRRTGTTTDLKVGHLPTGVYVVRTEEGSTKVSIVR
jgi:hypothetical protein